MITSCALQQDFSFIISMTDEIILCLFKHDCVPSKSEAEIIKDNPNIHTDSLKSAEKRRIDFNLEHLT